MKLQQGVVYATRIFSVGNGETNQTWDKKRPIAYLASFYYPVTRLDFDFLYYTNTLYKEKMIAIIKIFPKQNIEI